MLVSAILLAAAGTYFETGEGLYRKCIGNSAEQRTFCNGYIAAVSDTIVTYKSVGARQPVCVTTEPTLGDLRDAVVAYLRDNPAQRSLAASDLVVLALKRSYPCKSAGQD